MKKTFLTGLVIALMAIVPINGSVWAASQTIDAPHVNLDDNANQENCSLCHFSSGAYACEDCHNNTTDGGFDNLSAPQVSTHQGRAPEYKCQVCHNPHVSLQNGVATPMVSGTIDSVSPTSTSIANPEKWSAKTKNDRGLTFWVTVGDESYSYEVTSGAADTIVVKGGLVDGLTIPPGSAFELQYGMLIAKKVGTATPSDYTTEYTYRQDRP